MVVGGTEGETVVASSGDVVFNEIHYHPVDDHPAGEFVELYNKSDSTVDLGGWCVDGIKYCSACQRKASQRNYTDAEWL